ncbi:hypothetical protein KIN20_010690 [Parelaphostrongylus tenuis]|uniref:Uncharacterized protein n=1 Tax=Parelaphostrongylus tenuis TaxID=148309 RepID=A0AAD5MTV6_PARTN|nr:hypothetical protein KIN20_010690 [Parelaphostrongylus tenuis]
MNVLANMAKFQIHFFMILLMATLLTVLGCGVIPAASTRNFTVTSFTFPVVMVYSTAVDAPTRVPGIATNETVAKGFVERLVMQTMSDLSRSRKPSS